MNYTEAKRHYLELLGRDRTTPAPRLRVGTFRELHEWKQEARAYDAARIELKLVTPREVQERNAATAIRRGHARIVRRAAYG